MQLKIIVYKKGSLWGCLFYS